MNISEILKAKGIEDEAVKEILEEMKANKVYTASEENLDIRYGKLKTDHEGKLSELAEAQKLIEDLKKSTKGNEGLQQKITDYESQIAQLQKELNEAKSDAAMDRLLIAEGANASDLDYLKFQWRKKGDILLDENGEVKNGSDSVAGLKTQYPTQFGASGIGGSNGFTPVENTGLPNNNQNHTVTRDQFQRMNYEERVKLKQQNEALYKQLAK